MILNSPYITGSLTVTGNITASGGITISGSISSASYAANADRVDGLDSTSFVFTSSYVVDSGSMSSRVTTIESKYATTGSNIFQANQTICGNLTTTGTITAQTINVQQVTSSIVYSCGSNIFGCALIDRQQMTGSVTITGSLVVTTTAPELTVGATGVTLGNVVSDIHQVTGSMFITGSTLNVTGGTICTTGNTCFGGMSIVRSCVGIGTVAPTAPLEVYSSNTFNTTTGANSHLIINYNSNTAGGPAIEFTRVGVSDWTAIQADLSGGTRTLKFIQTNGGVASTQMVINANDGKV
jgi:hypothetical protein